MSQLEVLHEEPKLESYTLLEEHQAQTPSTFFGANPVLYHTTANTEIAIEKLFLDSNSCFANLQGPTSNGTSDSVACSDVEPATVETVRLQGIDVWVSSRSLLLFSTVTKKTLSIPYPNISLHAIEPLQLPGTDTRTYGLYLQLDIPNSADAAEQDREYDDPVVLTIIPKPSGDMSSMDTASTSASTRAATQALYDAVSKCADLHPDPHADDDSEERANGHGGLEDEEQDGEPSLGSGQWITADNMHEYFDEEGQFLGFDRLGAGAGTVRQRGDSDGGVDGDEGLDGEETKWRRTQ